MFVIGVWSHSSESVRFDAPRRQRETTRPSVRAGMRQSQWKRFPKEDDVAEGNATIASALATAAINVRMVHHLATFLSLAFANALYHTKSALRLDETRKGRAALLHRFIAIPHILSHSLVSFPRQTLSSGRLCVQANSRALYFPSSVYRPEGETHGYDFGTSLFFLVIVVVFTDEPSWLLMAPKGHV